MISVMVRYGLLMLTLTILAGTVAFVFQATSVPAACQPSFSDDFNGGEIDTTRWDTYYKSGRTELQFYSAEALDLSNGKLRITADARPQEGYAYTSGIITTQTTFAQQYGYFEMRAKIPRGQGLWPAFWLLHTGPLPWTEVDVFEFLGHDTTKVYLYHHWRDSANNHQQHPKTYIGSDFSTDYHVYAIDWKPGRIIWYIDGVKRAETTENVAAEPMFMLINLAVGGKWPGSPDHSTRFPAYFEIDYVRVYPADCQPPAKPTKPALTWPW